MEFNSAQSELMHFGKLNQGEKYRGNGKALGNVIELRHIGVQLVP